MYSRFILFLASGCSVFGLTSCTKATQEDSWRLTEPQVVSQTGTVRKLRDLSGVDSVDANAGIDFGVSATEGKVTLDVQANCTRNGIDFKDSFHIPQLKNFPVSRILPREIWNSPDLSNSVTCAFKFKAENEHRSTHSFEITDLKIANFASLEKLPGLTSDFTNISESGEFVLACERFSNYRRSSTALAVTVMDLINGPILDSKQVRQKELEKIRRQYPLQKCRLLTFSWDFERAVNASPISEVRLRDDKPEITQTFDVANFREGAPFTGQWQAPEQNLDSKGFVSFEIRNLTDVPMTLSMPDIARFKIDLQQAVYMKGQAAEYFAEFDQEMRRSLIGLSQKIEGGADFRNANGRVFFEINPGEIARIFIGFSGQAFLNSWIQPGGTFDPNSSIPQHLGYLYRLTESYEIHRHLEHGTSVNTNSIDVTPIKLPTTATNNVNDGWIPRASYQTHGSAPLPFVPHSFIIR